MVFVETKDHIKNQVSLALSVERGTLIDIETSGLPKDKEHEIISLGYITSNNLVIITRKLMDKEPYYSEIKKTIKWLPAPFYSYNAEFEREIMQTELGLYYDINDFIDLQIPWKVKAENMGLKWPKLDELISEPEEYFSEMQIAGKDVPGLWKAYLVSNSEKLLKMIAQHNLSDLLRETVLLLLHPELYSIYQGLSERHQKVDYVDNKG